MTSVVILPTQETSARLQRTFLSCPFTIDWPTLLVPLAQNLKSEPKVRRNVVHEARFTGYKIAFDEVRNQAELVGFLESETLKERAVELGSDYSFELKLIFLPYSPAQSQTVRNFNVSISDSLVLKETTPFTFRDELLLPD